MYHYGAAVKHADQDLVQVRRGAGRGSIHKGGQVWGRKTVPSSSGGGIGIVVVVVGPAVRVCA